MRGLLLLLCALGACSPQAGQSASFDGVFPLGTYVFLEGDAEDYSPGTVGSASTTRPMFPPLSAAKDRALLLGWSEFLIAEGTEVRIAEDKDRVLPPVDFAAAGDIAKSQVVFVRIESADAPLLARVDNDTCTEVAAPDMIVGGCPDLCSIRTVRRDGCRLDLAFSDCPIPDLTLRLGDDIVVTESQGDTQCIAESGASPTIRCGRCRIYFLPKEPSPWVQIDSVQLADPGSDGADHSLTHYHQGPFPGLAISNGLIHVPTYDFRPWPVPCSLGSEDPVKIKTIDPASLVVTTSTSGACSGVPRAHSDGRQMWWAFDINFPQGPTAAVALFHDRSGLNWPTQQSNFKFGLLGDGLVPLRLAAQDNLLWVVSGVGSATGRKLVGAQLHKLTDRPGESLLAQRIVTSMFIDSEVIDVAVMEGVELPLILNGFSSGTYFEVLDGNLPYRACKDSISSRRLKTFGQQGFALHGDPAELFDFRPGESRRDWSCGPHYLVAAWGPVVDVAPWSDGLWLVAQTDAQDILRIVRYDPANKRLVLPAIELAKGTMVDATVDAAGRVFALLPGRGQLIRLTPRP